jgi:hypothetical protein
VGLQVDGLDGDFLVVVDEAELRLVRGLEIGAGLLRSRSGNGTGSAVSVPA